MDKSLPDKIFRFAFDLAPDAMVMVRKNGEIADANDQAVRLFGYPKKDMIGTTIELLVPLSIEKSHVAFRDKFLENPVARPLGGGLQLKARCSDGREVEVAVSLSPIYVNGVETIVLASIRACDEWKPVNLAQAKNKHSRKTRRTLIQRLTALVGNLPGNNKEEGK